MRSSHALEAVTEEAEEGELISLSGFANELGERELNWRIREAVVAGDILKAQRLEDIEDGVLEIGKIHAVGHEITVQIDRDALGDMFGQPPAIVTRVFGGAADGSGDPALVKAGAPPVGKVHERHAVT